METKLIKIGNKEFKIKELSFFDEIEFFDKSKDRQVNLRKMLEMCIEEPKITDDLLKSMNANDGNKLLNEINKLNGWLKGDFQKPPKT